MLYCRILATIGSLLPISTEAISQPWDVFDQAKRLVEAESFGRDGRGWLARLGTSLAVADGNLVAALHWTEELVDPFWSAIGKARIRLATGDREAAGELATACALCPASGRSRTSPRPMRHRSGGGRETRGHSGRNSRREQLLQTIASEGIETVELVEQCRMASPWTSGWPATGRCTDLVASGSGQLVEPLTDRTGRPAFFAQPVDDPEIADELYVSVNTLKFHLKVIYRKLGVNSRAEAAEGRAG